MKIGITGSLSSGKSSVAKILSKDKKILFSADKVVKELYFNKQFKIKIKKRFKIKEANITLNTLKVIVLKLLVKVAILP